MDGIKIDYYEFGKGISSEQFNLILSGYTNHLIEICHNDLAREIMVDGIKRSQQDLTHRQKAILIGMAGGFISKDDLKNEQE